MIAAVSTLKRASSPEEDRVAQAGKRHNPFRPYITVRKRQNIEIFQEWTGRISLNLPFALNPKVRYAVRDFSMIRLKAGNEFERWEFTLTDAKGIEWSCDNILRIQGSVRTAYHLKNLRMALGNVGSNPSNEIILSANGGIANKSGREIADYPLQQYLDLSFVGRTENDQSSSMPMQLQ